MQQHEMSSKTIIAKDSSKMPQQSRPYLFEQMGLWLSDEIIQDN
jgi:hypothetical protein